MPHCSTTAPPPPPPKSTRRRKTFGLTSAPSAASAGSKYRSTVSYSSGCPRHRCSTRWACAQTRPGKGAVAQWMSCRRHAVGMGTVSDGGKVLRSRSSTSSSAYGSWVLNNLANLRGDVWGRTTAQSVLGSTERRFVQHTHPRCTPTQYHRRNNLRVFFLGGGGFWGGGGGLVLLLRNKKNFWYRGGGWLVRTQLGMAKFGGVKIWFKILNSMEKCGTNFPAVDIPGTEPETSNSETQYVYNSANCFLCHSPVKQASKLKHDVLKKFLHSTGCSNGSAPCIPWLRSLNTVAKCGTILLCHISPYLIPPLPKFPPSGVKSLAVVSS